ncbi:MULTISPECIES: hypothetical protein [unclassified Tolypothrix]|uniref:hypothetical protein n=1 Tax=unclassified Tolypothrix TaxID=2649714 RepID=UPI0005EAA42E|nr:MULTISPECIES: hypothetical protein [unclassified Tolypothrix]BAY88682.1 hypothetical protein NIES3275_06600 [Microchaete diplosiphon NIES-3275]EKF01551.1 hypothetical protein FDUTEX481_07686 [Tolypothrix sp. PCC 7601]MBE9085355.1 hypothetical protein [Tolypothrix sp. LEGE 11397]UYD29353.1 hypothetical protein HGR01_15690 [Tolypothrix sp. PCC 7712]UYD34740.1 hypothetical protein HG267_02650 [Tolypothrix sp. PCC 7601]
MNLYFLVEGKRTERKVYPAWLAYLLPELKQVKNYDEVEKNNYYLFSAEGYPSIIYEHLPNAIADVQDQGNYNYLVVCLDADENTVGEIQNEIYEFISSEKIKLGNIELVIIVQNRCFETWFLGNRNIYSRQPQDRPLLDFVRYYDVSVNCPELMDKYPDFNTHAQFHAAYLKELFKAKNINYSKKNPGDVLKPYYIEQLLKRIKDQNQHLPSFQTFIEFCNTIRLKISN